MLLKAHVLQVNQMKDSRIIRGKRRTQKTNGQTLMKDLIIIKLIIDMYKK